MLERAAARAEEHGVRGSVCLGAPTERFLTGTGYIVINRAGQSLDAHCEQCGMSINKSWLRYARARKPPTRARGRPMGALLAILNLERGCPGDLVAHRLEWHQLTLTPYRRRKLRKEAIELGGFEACFARERSPNASDVEGEPPGLALL